MVAQTQKPLQEVRVIDRGSGYQIEAIGRWKVSMTYYHDRPVTDYLGRFQFVKIDDRTRKAVLETKYDKLHDYRYTELFEVVNQETWEIAAAKIPDTEKVEWEQEMVEEATPPMPADAYARQLYARKGFRERPKRLSADGITYVVDTPLGPVNEEALRALVASGEVAGQVFGDTPEQFAGPPGDVDNVANPGPTELQESGSPQAQVAQPLDIVDMMAADPELQQRALDALIAAGTFTDKDGNPLRGVILTNKLAAKTPTESTPLAE